MNGKAIFEQHESIVRSYCNQFPVVFEYANEHILETEDGTRYVDFLSGAGALNYGHNPKEIIAPLIQYLHDGRILNSLDLHTTAKREFIEAFESKILQPRNLNYKLQFTGPTGTNAVEAALKLARKVTGRTNIVAFTNAFHGMTLGSLSVTGSGSKRKSAGVQMGNVTRMPFDGYLGAGDSIDYMRKMLLGNSSGNELPAAFIVETVQGEGGLSVASQEWLVGLHALAKEVGALLIVDDIQAGCGRTGSFFSFERANIAPDIVCLSKSISGCGLPMALVLLRPELDIWEPGEHNGTFRGNNLAFVAATAAIEYWVDPEFEKSLIHKAGVMSRALSNAISQLSQDQAKVVGTGLFLGIEFRDQSLAGLISKASFSQGLLVETCGPCNEVIKLMPPINIAEGGVSKGLDILTNVIVDQTHGLVRRLA